MTSSSKLNALSMFCLKESLAQTMWSFPTSPMLLLGSWVHPEITKYVSETLLKMAKTLWKCHTVRTMAFHPCFWDWYARVLAICCNFIRNYFFPLHCPFYFFQAWLMQDWLCHNPIKGLQNIFPFCYKFKRKEEM